jgi:hypothetical protein
MRTKIVFASILAAAFGIGSAAAAEGQSSAMSFQTGNQLYDFCTSPSATYSVGVCYGYVLGVYDFLALAASQTPGSPVCIPEHATVQELVDTVKKFLTDNPSTRHNTASGLVLAALAQAFPCAPPQPSPAKK